MMGGGRVQGKVGRVEDRRVQGRRERKGKWKIHETMSGKLEVPYLQGQ